MLLLKSLGENDINTGLQLDQLEKIRTIRVTVFRAKAIKRAVPCILNNSIPKTFDDIPEKMLKGKAIKNNIK